MKSIGSVPLGLGVFVVGACLVTGTAASADFWGSTIEGDMFYGDELIDSFESSVDGEPEYVFRFPDLPFDGYYIDFIDDTVTFKFSTWYYDWIYWPEGEFNGWTFADLDLGLDPAGSVDIVDSSGAVDWSGITAGIVDEGQFYVDFGTLGSDQQIRNGDFVTFQVSFIPAPTGAILLLGVFHRRRRR
jgi:hypothetical protein